MPYVCQKCGFVSQEKIEECPECGGFVEEREPEIDWMGEGKEKDGDEKDNNETTNL